MTDETARNEHSNLQHNNETYGDLTSSREGSSATPTFTSSVVIRLEGHKAELTPSDAFDHIPIPIETITPTLNRTVHVDAYCQTEGEDVAEPQTAANRETVGRNERWKPCSECDYPVAALQIKMLGKVFAVTEAAVAEAQKVKISREVLHGRVSKDLVVEKVVEAVVPIIKTHVLTLSSAMEQKLRENKTSCKISRDYLESFREKYDFIMAGGEDSGRESDGGNCTAFVQKIRSGRYVWMSRSSSHPL